VPINLGRERERETRDRKRGGLTERVPINLGRERERETRERKREDTYRESGHQVRQTLDVVPSDFEFEEERGARKRARQCVEANACMNPVLIEP
jgi:hypothetical protein